MFSALMRVVGSRGVILFTACICLALVVVKASWNLSNSSRPASNDPVAAAYQVATQMPDVLSLVVSECPDCKHQSILDCFNSGHARSCPTCVDEALSVGRLKRAGKSLAEIQRYVHNVFGFDVK
jgi:hypothetical protein